MFEINPTKRNLQEEEEEEEEEEEMKKKEEEETEEGSTVLQKVKEVVEGENKSTCLPVFSASFFFLSRQRGRRWQRVGLPFSFWHS